MKNEILFIGLDVHAQTISVAIAENSGAREVRMYGTIPNCLHALERMLAKLKRAHPGCRLKVAYEAGPTGFVIARRLAQLKVDCTVAAPSRIPFIRASCTEAEFSGAAKLWASVISAWTYRTFVL